MADHEFFGTVSVSEAATANDHVTRKAELDAAVAALNAALAGKAASSHTHTASQITDFQSAVDARVQVVVGAAPAALDTLKELADALGDDPNFAATVTGQISAVANRVTALESNAGTGFYRVNIGDGSAKTFTVTHGLNTLDVGVEVVRVSDGQTVFPVIKRPSTTTVTVDFGSAAAPTAAQYRVLVSKS